MSKNNLREALRRIGVSGQPVCAHTSLRSFGQVDGGADAIVDAFVEEGCTLLVPAFTLAYRVPPPPELRFARNGWDYVNEVAPAAGIGRIYTPATTEIDKDMGAVPAAVVARPGRVRGNHPLSSLAAIGPRAAELISFQNYQHVFGPLEALAKMGGQVLLMGVNLRRLTLLHVAERIAGRNMLRRWGNDSTGGTIAMEVGGCSGGFEKFRPHLSCLSFTKVGQSQWTFLPARRALEEAVEAIRRDPTLTSCNRPECRRCPDLVAGGPILDQII